MTQKTPVEKRIEETQIIAPLPDSSSLMRERREVLLGLYQENRIHLRHHESLRATVTNIIVVTTVGLIALVRKLEFNDWPLLLAIMLLGLFGSLFTAHQNEQVCRYKARSWKYDEGLDELLFRGTTTLTSIRENAEEKTQSKFALLRVLWPLAISIIAAGFMIYIVCCLPRVVEQDTETPDVNTQLITRI